MAVVNVHGDDPVCRHFKDQERFVERAEGFWKKEVEDGMYWYVCSECGSEVPRTRYKSDLFSAFCPHCGAVMKDLDEEAAE